MTRARRALLASILALAASGAQAAPRAARPAPAAAAAPDVFGGYSYTHAGDAGLHGIGLSGAYPIAGTFSLVLDLSAHDGSFAGADLDQLGLMAGVRWVPRSRRLQPFVEGLVGVARTKATVDLVDANVSDSDSDWGLALGGGADYRLERRWSLRALFHLRLLEGEGAWDADPRFALGAVYRFGR